MQQYKKMTLLKKIHTRNNTEEDANVNITGKIIKICTINGTGKDVNEKMILH